MKIVHALYWVQFAGTEKVCVDLCNELSKKHDVYILTNKKIKPYINENVKLIEVDFNRSRHNPFFLYEIFKLLKTLSPDIIHCHNTKELEIMYYSRFFLKNKMPIIATKHTLKPKKKYKLAELVVAILEDTLKIIDSENIIMIKNGMAYKEPKVWEKDNTFHIVSAARLSYQKGMDIIIKASSMLNFDFKLSLYGEGEERKKLEKLILDYGLEDKVNICGFVDNLNDYLFNSDVQIIASRYEPYGLTAIDGIYYSKVLLSTKTGICEQILPEQLLFDLDAKSLANKLTEVYKNYAYYIEIFDKTKQTKDIYSVEKMTRKYEKAYISLIQNFKKLQEVT